MSTTGDEVPRPAAWAHLTQVGHLLGLARRKDPFYLLITLTRLPHDEYMVEITFHPEYVNLNDHPSDLVVEWGDATRVHEWVDQFLHEFQVHLAPERLQSQLVNRLFRSAVSDCLEINLEDPWHA